MKKKQISKLNLNTETLISLRDTATWQVAGGVTASCIYTCNLANSCTCP
jgi:hypothetical protein